MLRLSEQTKREIINMPQGSVCLLTAPTGCGKSYFISHELRSSLRIKNKELLLVVNRTLLRFQNIHSLAENYESQGSTLNAENLFGSPQILSFPGICIVTYQYLAQILCNYNDRYTKPHSVDEIIEKPKSKPIPLSLDRFSVVVFDEAHFFLADSTFNPAIDAFKNVPSRFAGITRIYVSATMKPVRDIILQMEGIEDLWRTSEGQQLYPHYRYAQVQNELFEKMGIVRTLRRCSELSDGMADYSYLTPCIMNGYDGQALVEDIKNRINTGELKKALVFISSKKEGRKVQEALQQADISVAFLFDDESGNEQLSMQDIKEKQSIIKHERFNVRVLIATNVLDNGINIKDIEISHIYPDGQEEIALRQQVGRIRRLNDDQKIAMVLRPYGLEYLNRRIQQYKSQFNILQKYEQSSDIDRGIMAEDEFTLKTLRAYTFRDATGRRKVSFFAYSTLEYYIHALSSSISALQNDPQNGLVKRLLNWFNLDIALVNDKRIQEQNRAKCELEILLKETAEKELCKVDYDAFRVAFKEKYQTAFPVERLTSGKNNRLIGIHTLDNILQKFGYKISSYGTGKHILRETDSTNTMEVS